MKSKSYNEVLEMLSNIPIKDYLKIPREEISKLIEGQDENYEFRINRKLSIKEQNISRDAYTIFTRLYYQYIADDGEKQKIGAMLRLNDRNSQDYMEK